MIDAKNLLKQLKKHSFDTELLESVLMSYQQEAQELGLERCERDYQVACVRLSEVLSGEQLERVTRAEALYREQAKLNLEISFERGLYAGFMLVSDKNAYQESFERLVVEPSTKQPCEGDFARAMELQKKANLLLSGLEQQVDVSTAEHVVSIVSAWDERAFAALRYGFDLGCHAAQSIVHSL